MLVRVRVEVKEHPNATAASTRYMVVLEADGDDEAEQKAREIIKVTHRGMEVTTVESHGPIEYVIFNARLSTVLAIG